MSRCEVSDLFFNFSSGFDIYQQTVKSLSFVGDMCHRCLLGVCVTVVGGRSFRCLWFSVAGYEVSKLFGCLGGLCLWMCRVFFPLKIEFHFCFIGISDYWKGLILFF